jgi:hypothetical protein
MSNAVSRRTELASFLRDRRARITPADVGLPDGSRRRTPGLRREEVAELAHSRALVARFRLEAGRASDRAPFDQLANELAEVSPELRVLWNEHEVLAQSGRERGTRGEAVRLDQRLNFTPVHASLRVQSSSASAGSIAYGRTPDEPTSWTIVATSQSSQ